MKSVTTVTVEVTFNGEEAAEVREAIKYFLTRSVPPPMGSGVDTVVHDRYKRVLSDFHDTVAGMVAGK